jgi:predicted membrane chloride channel (bestrophin family)
MLTVPLSIFTLTAPSLGLLLVFKTNSAYTRWDNARKVWGDIINKCRSLVRQGNTFFVEDRYPGYGNFRDYRRRVAAETSAFTRCLRCFLRGKEDEENLRVELKELGFTPKEVAGYMKAANKQVYALQKIGETMRQYGLTPMDRANMDQVLTGLCDDVGACERIFKTPIPLVYTRHTSRFAGSWLLLLPLAIYGADSSWNHIASIPSVAVIVFFLLGIEELGSQLEEPFGILPIEAFCEGSIFAALNEMVVSEDEAREMEREIEMASAAAVGVVAAVPPEPAAAVADEAEEKEGFRARLSRKLAGGD